MEIVNTQGVLTPGEKKSKLTFINDQYENYVKKLVDGIPPSEIQTWGVQRAEAIAYSLNKNSPTPFIDGILQDRKKYTKDQLVKKILEKSTLFEYNIGKITGQRQHQEDILK